MFESLIIRPNSSRDYPLDCGQMIESLFFYGKTTVHIGRNEIRTLFDLADVDVLEELLKRPEVTMLYNNSHVGVAYQENIYTVDSFGLANLDIEKELYQESFSHRGDDGKSRKFSKKIARLIDPYSLPDNFHEAMTEQLKDKQFLKQCLLECIKRFNIGRNIDESKLEYELDFTDKRHFPIRSNIDFESAGFNSNLPILPLITACEDLHVSSQSFSEISLPEFNASMLRLKTNSLVEATSKSRQKIDVFNEAIFEESWALREAINKKQLHVKAVLPALRKAARYKEWLRDLPNDGSLIYEYLKKVEEKTVLERLNLKAIRFYIFTGIGTILGALPPEVAIPASTAASAFDAFLLDKLAKQWKPNQFIESDYRPLLKK